MNFFRLGAGVSLKKTKWSKFILCWFFFPSIFSTKKHKEQIVWEKKHWLCNDKGNNLPYVDLYGRTSVLCDCCGQDCVQDNMQFICKYYLLLFWLYFDWCLIFFVIFVFYTSTTRPIQHNTILAFALMYDASSNHTDWHAFKIKTLEGKYCRFEFWRC